MMREGLISSYIAGHLADLMAILSVLNQLSQKESSLEFHRFFIRLQIEIGEEPRVLKQLLFGLGEEEKDGEISSRDLEEMGRLKLEKSGLDPENPELFEALEWLVLEMQGKALMWKTLGSLSSRIPAWKGVDFKEREQRAKNQRDRVESVRVEVAADVLREY